MMQKYLSIIILAAVAGLGIFILNSRSQTITETRQSEQATTVTPSPTTTPDATNCTPTFRGGGGPNYQANMPFRNDLTPPDYQGEKLIVSGRVLQRDCTTPLANAAVDVWQADGSGNYENEWYRGRVRANENGEYSFETVVPQGYGEGTGYRPPHIHFKIWQDNRELVTSQMFVPDKRAQGIEEAYFMELETREENGVTTHFGTHDIVVP